MLVPGVASDDIDDLLIEVLDDLLDDLSYNLQDDLVDMCNKIFFVSKRPNKNQRNKCLFSSPEKSIPDL